MIFHLFFIVWILSQKIRPLTVVKLFVERSISEIVSLGAEKTLALGENTEKKLTVFKKQVSVLRTLQHY